jgi:SCY1-like protein 2
VSSKEEASVFVFEKKQLDTYARKDKDLILDYLRKGVSQLTRLRHPSVLIVQHPLEESRDSLAFATEPVTASLANLLGSHDNLPNPIPKEISAGEFYEIEIKYGLLSISEGLTFIHNDAKILHRNLCPEAIIISKRGSWKLFGFEFSAPPINPNDFPLKFPIINVTNQSHDFPMMALPNLDYLAPEYVTLASDPEGAVTLASDMYSLGSMTYTLYNKGKALLPTKGSLNTFSSGRVSRLNDLPNSTFNCIAEDSRHHVKSLLNINPDMRPDAHQFNKISIFEDILIRTLQYLDSLFQWDNLEKSKFYKGLPEIMARMPLRIKINRVIPCLIRELINPEMVPFVLPNLLYIADEMTEEEFREHLLDAIKPVFVIPAPIQIPLILLQNLQLIITRCKNTSPDVINTEVLSMMCRCLDSSSSSSESAQTVIQLQELCLKNIPIITSYIDVLGIKKQLLPKIKKLCLTTNVMSVKVLCLVTIGKILDQLDKWAVLDEVIPFLSEIQSREPAVIMASVGIIQMTLSKPKLGLTKEVMANKIIPYLMPISIENGLSVPQFNIIIALIKEIVNKVEAEQRIKVEQLAEMKEQQSMTVMTYSSHNKSSMDSVNGFVKISFKDEPERKELQAKPSIKTSASLAELSKKTTPINPPSSHQPKDLTSSLLSQNLANLSSKPMTQNFSTSPFNPMTAVSTERFPPLVPQSSSLSFGSIGSANYGITTPLVMQPMRPQTTSTTKPDLSAFDSLSLGNLTGKQSTGSRLPMNAMKVSSQNASSSTSLQPTPSQTVRPLSKSDFEELLK